MRSDNRPNLISLWFGMIFCLFTSASSASFEVMEQDEDIFYGNAANENFRRAIENEDPLDQTDRSFLAHVSNGKSENRSFWKFSVARIDLELDKAQLTTSPTTTTTTIPTQSDDIFELSLGFGHRWTSWELELELLIRERLIFTNTQPAVAPLSAYTLTADIQPFTLFTNLTYELPRLFAFIPSRLHPYVQVGAGVNYNLIDVSASAIGATSPFFTGESNSDLRLTWNVSLGLKIDITGQLMANFAYRHIDMHSAIFGPIRDETGVTIPTTHTAMVTINDFTSRGFYFGILYFN